MKKLNYKEFNEADIEKKVRMLFFMQSEIIDHIQNNEKFYDASNDWREINHISKEMYDKIIETQSCKPASKLDKASSKLEESDVFDLMVFIYELFKIHFISCPYFREDGALKLLEGDAILLKNKLNGLFNKKYEQAIKIDDDLIEWLRSFRNTKNQVCDNYIDYAERLLEQLGLEE